MKCQYYYKGRLIGDIRQLDDFLLSKHKYEASLGDMVFQKSAAALSTIEKVKGLEKESKQLEKDYRIKKRDYVDGEEITNFDRPYRGVTEFLTGYRNSEDRLLFPEFIANNYWSRRFYAWNLGRKQERDRSGKIIKDGFTEEEIELFFGGDDSNLENKRIPLGDPNTWMKNETEFNKEWGTNQQNELRAKMENKWKKQAQYGTELHNVLNYYFQKSKSGKYHFEEINGRNLTNTAIANLKNAGLISDITDYEKIKQLVQVADTIRKDIYDKYGDDVEFFPEITISAQLNKEVSDKKGYDKLLGRVDLLVVDKNGNAHIIDFKVSPKHYTDYNAAKELAYTYQLATYERILRQSNVKTAGSGLYIAPIRIENFKLDENGEWNYDGISVGGSTPLIELTKQNESDNINRNITEYMDVPVYIDADADDLIQKVSEQQKAWWPTQGERRKRTREEVIQMIQDTGGFRKEENKFIYESKHAGFDFVAKSEAELYNKVLSYYNDTKERNVKKTNKIKTILREAQKRNDGFIEGQEITTWLKMTLSKYASNQWEIVDGTAGEVMEQFGMIMIRNRVDNVYDVIKISNQNLKYKHHWERRKSGEDVLLGKRDNLTGALEPDISEDSKSESLMLKATTGNLELMEAMLVLNQLNFGGEAINIGRMQVINPLYKKDNDSTAEFASNKELKYCWDKLSALKPLETDNKIGEGKVKFLSSVENCYHTFKEIMALSAESHNPNKYKGYESFVTALNGSSENYNRETVLSALYALGEKLVKENPSLQKDISSSTGKSIHAQKQYYNQSHPEILYQMIQKAILELHNINLRQTRPTEHNYMPDFTKILTQGVSSNMIDNANNFANKILNDIANLALDGYQNTREQSLTKMVKIRKMVEEMKHETGFSGLKEHTIGNQADLYKGMTYYTDDGDLRFLNPWKHNTGELFPTQVEFLKHAIMEINKQRRPSMTDEQIQQAIENDSIEFFQVPLLEATVASKVSSEGWLGWLKSILKPFAGVKSLKDLKERAVDWAKRKESQFFDQDLENKTRDGNIFKIVNLFEQGGKEHRLNVISSMRKREGDGVFERDIERILLHHTQAYSVKDSMENRLPLIKAAYISLAVMGNDTNKDFSNDLKFMEEWVANKINHQSITDEKLKPVKGVLSVVQRAVSWMALAFAPIQMTGQSMDGIWQNAKLVITKPDGSETFTFENMKNAAKKVYADLGHMSDDPTLTSSVNAFYGINDMDSASFADNNSSNRHGLFNLLGRFAYRFSSRPDYYNRMTIFTAQMMADGSYEAHSVNSEGDLVYDWTKDKRFAAYANDPKGLRGKTDEWKKAKALYYTVAKQMITEGAKDSKGNLFKLGAEDSPTPLPKAYSNKESEARKAVGDNIYGYFDSTKKTLAASTLGGCLLLQMRTYLSAKKNKYLGHPGTKAQGKWVQAEQEVVDPNTKEIKKEKVFYAKKADGSIDEDRLVTESSPDCSDVAFLQWKGKFEEGILLTFWDFLKQWYSAGSFKDALTAKFGDSVDPELRKTYITNMKTLMADITMWLLVGTLATAFLGDWADDEAKKAKESGNLEDAMFATFANLTFRTVRYSAMDFAWWKTISDPLLDWNPMALSHISNDMSSIIDMAMGEKSFCDGLVSSFSAARQVRPMFTYIEDELSE